MGDKEDVKMEDAAKEKDVKMEGSAEAKEEQPEEEEQATEPPKAELTEEEKAMWFAPGAADDIFSTTLHSSLSHFSLPSDAEPFDEIRFPWQNSERSKAHFRSWLLEKKRTTRVEDIQPSQWFLERHQEWQKKLQEWQGKHKEIKSDPVRKEAARLKQQKADLKKKKAQLAAAQKAK